MLFRLQRCQPTIFEIKIIHFKRILGRHLNDPQFTWVRLKMREKAAKYKTQRSAEEVRELYLER
jgi:hypothetical protein